MCAQFSRERSVFRPAAYRNGAIAKLVSKLNAEMAQAADSLNGNQIAGLGATMAQRVEGGKAGAEKRTGIGGIERVGNAREGFDRSEHVLRVAAVEADAA